MVSYENPDMTLENPRSSLHSPTDLCLSAYTTHAVQVPSDTCSWPAPIATTSADIHDPTPPSNLHSVRSNSGPSAAAAQPNCQFGQPLKEHLYSKCHPGFVSTLGLSNLRQAPSRARCAPQQTSHSSFCSWEGSSMISSL